MTATLGLIAAVAVATYATRLAGLSLGNRAVPEPIERLLTYVPIAVFAALITPGVGGTASDLGPHVAGVAVTAATVLRWKQLWLGLILGMATFLLLRTVL